MVDRFIQSSMQIAFMCANQFQKNGMKWAYTHIKTFRLSKVEAEEKNAWYQATSTHTHTNKKKEEFRTAKKQQQQKTLQEQRNIKQFISLLCLIVYKYPVCKVCTLHISDDSGILMLVLPSPLLLLLFRFSCFVILFVYVNIFFVSSSSFFSSSLVLSLLGAVRCVHIPSTHWNI